MKPEFLANLPTGPGVYFFKDAHNTILYIGKATNLRTRVQSYFARTGRDWKIDALVDECATVDVVTTSSEMEAALLEAQLIQAHQPKYNVLLKSGQPFLYLLVTNEAVPELTIVRTKKEKGVYFGPFLHKSHARAVHRYITETFRLQLCNKKIAHGCLDYHLGLCAGRCRPDFNPDEYRFRINLAMEALRGDKAAFMASLRQKIEDYSKQLEFEKARRASDYLTSLETIFATLSALYHAARREEHITQAVVPHRFTPPLSSDTSVYLQELLHAPQPVHTIDCFDISHFQSTHLVGACVRFVDGRPDTSKCRRFLIRTLQQQDDYAALYEIVARRYKKQDDLPDAILIDGGKGQLHAIDALVPEVPRMSIAKKEERLYTLFSKEGIVLDPHTDSGKLLIGLRDYAHHFAVSYHRVRRRKAVE